jgi:putative membrane protein insertion efficiency factor
MTPDRRIGVRLALGVVAAYRMLLSPLAGGACRFSPSCSVYAEEALRQHGVRRGGWLAAKRIARCHPFGGFGYDPVPAGEGRAGTPGESPPG